MIPKNHPRFKSLGQRHLIEEGVAKGIVTPTGMIAHGRGEAFDYLLGEKTGAEAEKQIDAATCLLLLAEKPVISVNGNTTVLCAKEIIELAKECNARIEANVFYEPVAKRKKMIAKHFQKFGAKILFESNARINGLTSARQNVSLEGIYSADVVLVSLEDGDRTESLVRAGKKVIVVDLNPLSRSAQKATIPIVDNVVRAIPLLTKKCGELKEKSEKQLRKKLAKFNAKKSLAKSSELIKKGI